MDPDRAARALAVGRTVVGAALIAAPALVTRPWVGRPGSTPGGAVLARALGVRDLALGVGLLRSLGGGAPRGWIEAGALADGVDFAATLAAGSALPRLGRTGVLLVAGSATPTGLWLARSIAAPAEADS